MALQLTDSGAKSQVLRISVAGKQREKGPGSFPTVTLVQAREKARNHRAQLEKGSDPIAKRQAAQSAMAAEKASLQTFAAAASQYIAWHAIAGKNAKHESQWASTLPTCAEPVIGSLLVRDVKTAHVIKVLEPIWSSKTETATRVRSRIELVLDFAAARGLRAGPNPVRWRGNLDAALPRPNKLAKVKHHAAVAISEVAPFMTRFRQQSGVGARALEFAVLTAARSGEVRGAAWSELDLDKALWLVLADRMKSGREHRVPLSHAAVQLLQPLPGGKPDDLVFPGMRGLLSDMSPSAVLRRMSPDATAHGFRSTFRDWVSEHTDYPNEVAELALPHAVGNKVEAA